MKSGMKTRMTLCVITALMVVSGASIFRLQAELAQQSGEAKVDVTGTWAFQVEFAGGSGTPTMTFKQDGEKLTGHYSGQLGEAPLTGTVKGTVIEFAIDVDIQGTKAHIVYSGTVDKDTMKGTVQLGDLGDATFTAKKKPPQG